MTRLLINGKDYCEVKEMIITPEAQGMRQHRLILDKPVAVDLLERRRFEVLLPGGQRLPFDVRFDDEGGDERSLVGCLNPPATPGS